MWLTTRIGFFSVVQKPDEMDLTVRARVKADLENLRQRYLPTLGKITESSETDYRYRAKATHADFAEAVKKIAMDIDYPNFKQLVAAEQGSKRKRI